MLSVLIVLIFVKIITLPLDIRQRRSMNKMSALKPKLDSIKKRYPDPQIQQKKTQELYKKENIKPMSGCLPMLISMPILFALFGALRALSNVQIADIVVAASQGGDVQLTGWLWINNIWQPDSGLASIMPQPKDWETLVKSLNDAFVSTAGVTKANLPDAAAYQPIFDSITAQYPGMANGWFILPLLQTGLQMLLTKVTTAMQPTQQPGSGKMMMYGMALFSGYICIISPTIFAMYWLFSTVYGIAQTFVFNKFVFKKELEAANNASNA
jgi:YidC/Oxa1 family membrane protein insertase